MYCTAHRIILACLIVSDKYLNDSPYRNKSWASNSIYFSLPEVNLMERQLLQLLVIFYFLKFRNLKFKLTMMSLQLLYGIHIVHLQPFHQILFFIDHYCINHVLNYSCKMMVMHLTRIRKIMHPQEVLILLLDYHRLNPLDEGFKLGNFKTDDSLLFPMRTWLTSNIQLMTQVSNDAKNIVLPWPSSSKAIQKSFLKQGISSAKALISRMIYSNTNVKTPDAFSKIVLVGIHGWFPGKILKTGNLLTIQIK